MSQHYRSVKYQKARMIAMVRDGFSCQICGWERFNDLTIHHQISLARGGNHRPRNLVTLCKHCHTRIHAAAQAARKTQAAALVEQAALLAT
jgi:5-methylcytosine-specific restriction endonuclease McrA